ncbi:MAG: NADH-quinone oxidoreductase subunit J [Anaerolineae bacterium]
MELIFFFVAAAVAVLSALAMILSRHAVHSALFLILNFCTIAVLFLLLNAPFIAAIQVVVYAGAIMVLFLFVIMMLNVEQAEGPLDRLAWQKPVALALTLPLLAEVGYVAASGVLGGQPGSFTPERIAQEGHTELIARLLFTDYLYPFEIASILLLVAMVGAVVLAKRRV